MNVNTRADLDAIAGTREHAVFMQYLCGTLTQRTNTAIYPENYDGRLRPGDDGYVGPHWQDVEDLSVVERFGLTKEEVLAAAG